MALNCALSTEARSRAADSATSIAASATARIRTTLDPDALHALALIDIVWADTTGISLRRAISTLRTALEASPRTASTLTDLSAALLQRAERSGSAGDIVDAVDAAASAVAFDSSSEPARYDLALALDRLGIVEQASLAWNRYLARDLTTPWATLARAARARDQRWLDDRDISGGAIPESDAAAMQLVSDGRRNARLIGFDSVLGEWGRAILAGDREAANERLREADLLGRALARKGGDETLLDAVREIRRHLGTSRARLARAHVEFADGRTAFLSADYASADSLLQHVSRDQTTPEPLATWAAVFRSATMLQAGHALEALPFIDSLRNRQIPQRWPALAGQIAWAKGTALSRSGRYEASLDLYKQAEVLFVRAGEFEHVGALQYLVGYAQYALGQSLDRDQSFERAVITLRPYRRSLWLDYALTAWAGATSASAIRAATLMGEEGVAVAIRRGSPTYMAEARIDRSRLRLASHDSAGARADLAASGRLLDRVPPSAIRSWLRASWRIAKLEADPRHDSGAARALDTVVAFFEEIHNPYMSAPARVERAEVALSVGDRAGAEADLEQALTVVDTERAAIASASMRAAFLDARHRAVDQLILLRIGDPTAALSVAERGRACLTRNQARGASTTPVGASVPLRVTGLDYALIGDTLLAWTVRNRDVSLHQSTVDTAELRSTIGRVRSELEMRTADRQTADDLANLYDLLVRPVDHELGPDGNLVAIVADGGLAGVPFAALRDRSTGRYLVERHAIRSVDCLATLADSIAPPVPVDRTVLVVADPAFDSRAFPGLVRLSGAREEARSIAAEYPASRVLADTAATMSAVSAALALSPIVHFAGHAVLDDDDPEQSYLVLAGPDAPGSSDRLTAAALERADLHRVRLVVLSACETGTWRTGRSGGLSGLMAAFVSAGAHGVIGSLWRVDDRFTSPLMAALHHAYVQSGDGASALRAAQLELLHGSDPDLRSPAVWAAFRYGGS